LISTLLHFLRPALAPIAVLAAAAVTVAVDPTLPPSLAGLRTLGPYLVFLLGVAIGAWFNRGRAFIMVASLFAAYAGYSFTLGMGADTFSARAVYTAIAILVPANVLLALLFPERGVRAHHNYRWPLFAAAELLAVAWIASAGRSSFSGTAWQDLFDVWLLRSPPMPPAGRMLFAAAFIAAIARAWPRAPATEPRPLDTGLAGALVAFFIACEWAATRGAFVIFMTAAGAILLVALLQESHRLAFRDELTGLPGRRALDERLSGLGPAYAIAMVDVDHFKKFNDTHGHHTGDQVLKLVAARLAKVGGGGVAYRYGGEEFAVLFPERGLAQVLPHLENIRASIESYRMAVRGESRPKDAQSGSKLRAGTPTQQTLSVTVSIGAAESTGLAAGADARITPAMVLHAADEALYRAKRGGRNRVSR
jgi:diguanylate cyclase (GGDEF)-like protein